MNSMLAGAGTALWLALSLLVWPSAVQARDTLSVVGSSTVYPFATVVAERFGRRSPWPAPRVEAVGSGGGFKLFCRGIGPQTPDITVASRRLLPAEFAQCRAHGVTAVTELVIGYGGIVLAAPTGAPLHGLSLEDLYLALARRVPAASGNGFVANPYTSWQQVNPALPDTPIKVFGPPPTSGTRDAFDKLAMQAGCRRVAAVLTLRDSDPQRFRTLCRALREDGAFIEVGESDNLVVRRLTSNPQALGIIGFSYLARNQGRLQGLRVAGVAPDRRTIANRTYPLARPLYLYVKNAHAGVVPGLSAFVREFVGSGAVGPQGYLVNKGLIPAPEAVRRTMVARAAALTPLTAAMLTEVP